MSPTQLQTEALINQVQEKIEACIKLNTFDNAKKLALTLVALRKAQLLYTKSLAVCLNPVNPLPAKHCR